MFGTWYIIALVDAGTFKTFQYYTDKVLGEDAGCFQAIPVNSLDYYFVLLNLPEGAQCIELSASGAPVPD